MSETAAAAAPAAPSTPATPSSSGVPPATSAQSKPASTATPDGKAAATPSAPQLKEYKIDGKVVKLTAEEADQYVSLGFASDKRFKDAAQLRKQSETLLGRLRDPKQVMSVLQDPALGYTKDQIRAEFEEWYSQEFIEPEKLSPLERELKAAKAELQNRDKKDKDLAEEKLRIEQDQMTTQQREMLQKQLIETLETGLVPKTNFSIRRLAYWTRVNNENGFNATPQQLANQVVKEYHENLRDAVAASDGDVLIRLLGDEVIQKLRKHDLEQLRKTRGLGNTPPQQTERAATRTNAKAPTSLDVNKRLRELQRTGDY